MQFAVDTTQMLSDLDPENIDDVEPSPQLLEDYPGIHMWAKEYFRSRFRQVGVDDNVAAVGVHFCCSFFVNNFLRPR